MPVKAKFLGREKVAKLLRDIAPEAEKALAEEQLKSAQLLKEKISAAAPSESGKYRSSILAARLADMPGKSQLGGGISDTKDTNAAGVFADWIWRFLEFGTQSHVIEPKTGEYLVIRQPDGSAKYVKRVRHPGAVKRPHIFPIYRAFKPTIRRRMAAALRKSIKKLKG